MNYKKYLISENISNVPTIIFKDELKAINKQKWMIKTSSDVKEFIDRINTTILLNNNVNNIIFDYSYNSSNNLDIQIDNKTKFFKIIMSENYFEKLKNNPNKEWKNFMTDVLTVLKTAVSSMMKNNNHSFFYDEKLKNL